MDLHVEQRGDGPPLLLLHGMFGAGDDWRHVFDLDALGRAHRLVIPDLRGHGRTPPAASFSIGECAADVLELMDRLGLERCGAIGMSLGAKTLLHVATRAAARVEAMVLVSATPYFPAEARAIMRAVSDETRTPAEWAELRAKHVHGDEQIRALTRAARGFAERHDDLAFTPPALAAITARTLIVHGDRDPLYPVERALELYRGIAGSSLWVVPGGGHGPIFEEPTHSEFVARAMDHLRR
jgi:pimeloyl-ACP methyl ester carboxylesterase